MATKREVELELGMWQARAEGVQHGMSAIQAQASLLQMKSAECAENVNRLQAQLGAIVAAEEAAAKAATQQTAEPVVAVPAGTVAQPD